MRQDDTLQGAEEVAVRFHDREDAGRRLAAVVRAAGIGGDDVVVLGLPRGGVPVADQVAQALGLPLDVIVIRKLGVPLQPELAMGAIGEGGVAVVNEEVVQGADRAALDFAAVVQTEQAEVARRAARYRGNRDRLDLRDRQALIVDDGIATGSSARAACRVARAQGVRRVIFAAPVASAIARDALRRECDQIVCVAVPESFFAVGEWYDDFSQTTDEEVVALLEDSGRRHDPSGP
jgi:predicted phosphoribosyltransferase